MTAAHEPITADEATSLFAPLARHERLLLAVSGGCDSLALLVLIAEWQARTGNKAPDVSVATVDHGLRPESADEAGFVAERCQRLGISHATLPWIGLKSAAGVADAARAARYRLLEDHARQFSARGAVAVVTAHTEDDQAETLLMRLKRGSGVDGLASIPAERPLSPGSAIMLVRPLLAVSKTRLMATLRSRGLTWCEDPTNADQNFERVRLRKVLAGLKDSGVTAAALSLTARRMRDARDALDFAVDAFESTLALSFNNEVFASCDRAAFERAPVLLRQRVLARLIGRFGGTSPAPELSEIEALVAHLAAKPKAIATLGGTVITAGERTLRVWREAGRMADREINLVPGEAVLWDNRFWVGVGKTSAEPVSVKPLGPDGFLAVSDRVIPARRPPSRAAQALPSFWSSTGLLAVPSLALYGLGCGSDGHPNTDAPTAIPVHANPPRG